MGPSEKLDWTVVKLTKTLFIEHHSFSVNKENATKIIVKMRKSFVFDSKLGIVSNESYILIQLRKNAKL